MTGRRVGVGHQDPLAALGGGLECHSQNALDRRVSPVRRQFADDGVIAGPVERDLTAGQQQPQPDRQIKTVGVLLEVGRSELSKRTYCEASWNGW